MKKFNPDKELSKIKNGNKKKVIISICTLLLIIAIGSTYALYQVRHSKELTHITVKQFYQNDLDLAVYVDGVKKVTEKDFPTKENGTNLIYTGIKCEDGKEVNASWDYDIWTLDVKSKLPNKCNVYFETRYKDESGASYPELYQGLIPITIGSNGEIKIANLSQKWYDYNAHEWANAVLVTDAAYKRIVNEDGTFNTNETISLDTDILQMYVWIPRYKYKLFNSIIGQTSEAQMIEIEFENNTTGRSVGNNNGDWYTHPAFLFGDTELNGIWVSKFEPSGTNEDITILPDKVSLRPTDVSTMFNITRNIEKNNKYSLNSFEVDTHMMKSIEWGAMSYLTYSKYGRCTEDGTCTGPTVNAHTDYVTGYANTNDFWYTENGVLASTTGNPYGIFDIVGGSCEYVMGIMMGSDGKLSVGKSGFLENTFPNKKYYDVYSYSTSMQSYERGHLGDATREVLKTTNGNWDSSLFRMVSPNAEYMLKSGFYGDTGIRAGLFYTYNHPGNQSDRRILDSFRPVLTAQDGVD